MRLLLIIIFCESLSLFVIYAMLIKLKKAANRVIPGVLPHRNSCLRDLARQL